MIVDNQGHRITPSCVSSTDDEQLVSDSAKIVFHSNPFDNVFDAERLIGRNMDKADLITDMKNQADHSASLTNAANLPSPLVLGARTVDS